MHSNSVTRLGKVLSDRCIVSRNLLFGWRLFIQVCVCVAGALNWATGETVAVKEIQLSNIPKGELGEIMVSHNNISTSY